MENINSNSYINQKERALQRKLEAIENKGGKCIKCGYNKNISALEFHHIDPKDKEFQLDSRHFSNTNVKTLKDELDKCALLCSNCHREEHHPNMELSIILNRPAFKNKKTFNTVTGTECPVCKILFKTITGKIYCSNICRKQDKNLPLIEDIIEQYSLLKNWEKVATHFNTSRRVIQNIRARIPSVS